MNVPKIIEENARVMPLYGAKESMLIYDEGSIPFYILGSDLTSSVATGIPRTMFVRGRKISFDEYEFFGHGILWGLLETDLLFKLLDRFYDLSRKFKQYAKSIPNYSIPTFLVDKRDCIKAADEILEIFGFKDPFDELYELQTQMSSTTFDIHLGFLRESRVKTV